MSKVGIADANFIKQKQHYDTSLNWINEMKSFAVYLYNQIYYLVLHQMDYLFCFKVCVL